MNKMNEARMNWLDSIYEKCKIGEQVYNIIVSKKGIDTGIIFSPANVGDTVWLAALAGEYKKHHQYKKLIFVVKEQQKEIVEMFPDIDGVLPITFEKVICLRYYIMVKRFYYNNGIRYGHFPTDLTWEEPYMLHCLDCKDNILEHMWQTVLDIPFDCLKGKIKKPELEDKDGKVKTLLSNSVLLMPGSFTIRGIPTEFWERLARKLESKGLKVYTNYVGLPYDIMVPGTEALETSFNEIAAYGSYFKSIIGIRSGICDFLAMTDCKLNVLYPSGDNSASIAAIEKGVLNDDVRDLNDRANIWNYRYSQNMADELIDVLVNSIKI